MIEQAIQAGGLELRLLGWNTERDERALVVLHGFLEQGLAWKRVAEHLQRPVYALDQRGHGRSGHIAPGAAYEFWDYVSDLDAVLEVLSPDQPVDLLGHSMGGTVACLYAGSRPERLHRLVLVEGLGPPDDTASLLQRARAFLLAKRRPPVHSVLPSVEHAASRMKRLSPSLPDAFALELATRQTEEVPGGVRWRWDARHRSRSPRPFDVHHFKPFLHAITTPTVAIFGAASNFPGRERLTELQHVQQVEVPQAGHLVHHDAPLELATRVERALAGGPAG